MKKLALTISTLVVVAQVATALTITNFGTGSFTPQAFGNDFTISAQDASSITISGTPANQLAGVITPIDISAQDGTMTLSGSFTQGSGSLVVNVFDSGFAQSTFTGGSWADLVSSGVTNLTFVGGGAADLTDIAAVVIAGGGSPAAAVAGSFNDLSVGVVPEPSTAATLAGLMALGYVMLRRRQA